MGQLIVDYTVGQCSGPLKTYLLKTGALTNVARSMADRFADTQLAKLLPYEHLFVTVRYGCADFYGKPTELTVTTPTKEWKGDQKRGEFLAFVALDGHGWEHHDKAAGKRSYLEQKLIEAQVESAVWAALRWVAKLHQIGYSDLGPAMELSAADPGIVGPDDLPAQEVAQLLKRVRLPSRKQVKLEPIDLEVVFPIIGFGTREDMERKERITALLRSELEARHLGKWTGDSVGSGTFEVGFSVKDPDLAKSEIRKILKAHDLDAGLRFEEL